MTPRTAMAVFAALMMPLAAAAQMKTYALDSVTGLKLRNVTASAAAFKGRKAVRITEETGQRAQGDEDRLAIIEGSDFHDGTIEVDVAGQPASGAMEGARGFVGIAFRVAPDASRWECIYLRPTNGRADDQVRRNHSVQYISVPGYGWQRLRKEEPEKYETYVDLTPGEWTKVKIEVQGTKARLYVNGAAQPTLLVNDLKKGDTSGAVALWIGPGTEAHFANLRLSGSR